LGLQSGRLTGDFHGLRGLPGRENKIEEDPLLDGYGDVAMLQPLEPFEFSGDTIVADFDRRENVLAANGSSNSQTGASVLAGEGDFGSWQNAARAVLYSSQYGAGIDLGEHCCSKGEQQCQDLQSAVEAGVAGRYFHK
jgi:hypothetical protein